MPLVARKMGDVTAAATRISVESFSFPVAIKVSPEVIVTAKAISRVRLIRLTIDFMTIGLRDQD